MTPLVKQLESRKAGVVEPPTRSQSGVNRQVPTGSLDLNQAGNQAIQRLLRSGAIRPKLAISHPDDPEEREADDVANKIMRSPGGFPVSSTPCSCAGSGHPCDECQGESVAPTIHRSASSPSAGAPHAPTHAPSIVGDVLRSPGHPLDRAARSFFEPRFNQDLSHVRIHTNAEAAASAHSIQANAYAAGSDIVFAQNQYAPDATPGRLLLAHELAHVLQTQRTTLPNSPSILQSHGNERVHRQPSPPAPAPPAPTEVQDSPSEEATWRTRVDNAVRSLFRLSGTGLTAKNVSFLDQPKFGQQFTGSDLEEKLFTIFLDNSNDGEAGLILKTNNEPIAIAGVTSSTMDSLHAFVKAGIAKGNFHGQTREVDVAASQADPTTLHYLPPIDRTPQQLVSEYIAGVTSISGPRDTRSIKMRVAGGTFNVDTLSHETCHFYISNAFRNMAYARKDGEDFLGGARISQILIEGFAEYFSEQVMRANVAVFGPPVFTYPEEVAQVGRIVETLDEASVRAAYFGGDARQIRRVSTTVDECKIVSPDLMIPDTVIDAQIRDADAAAAAAKKAATIQRSPSTSAPSTAGRDRTLVDHTSTVVNEVLRSPGHPLDAATRSFFEPRFNQDLSHVRLHTNTEAAASARSIQANAYALGSNIVFAQNQYAPGSTEGRHLLAHELAHVSFDSLGETLHRRPAPAAPAALDIAVADPDPALTPSFLYPWQNPQVRKTIYPDRDKELIFFLRTYKEIDLENPSTPVEPVTSEDLTEERARVQKQLDDVATNLKDANKANDAARIAELSADSRRLKSDLKYLPQPAKGKVPIGADKKWTAYKYSKLAPDGSDMGHDALLSRILDRFDSDPNFTRYPKWLRYMVLHFSGMRYDSASGSFASPEELLKKLKRAEIQFDLTQASEPEIAAESEIAVHTLQSELAVSNPPDKAKTSTIKGRISDLTAVETERAAAFSGKGNEAKRIVFEDLIALEDKRASLKSVIALLDPASPGVEEKANQLNELDVKVEADESQIGSAPMKAERARLNAAENKRRTALIANNVEVAEQAIAQLDEKQVLSVFRAMQASKQFPDWVWREIVRLTPLKLELGNDPTWETVTKQDLADMNRTDSTTRQWTRIMKDWKKEDAWRIKHISDLSLVAIRAVCDQVAEMALRARGLQPDTGIQSKTLWYASKAKGGSFFRPTTNGEVKPGASLFFLEWSNSPPKFSVAKVRSDLGVVLQSEKGEGISDGFHGADDWTYHFAGSDSITRTRPIASPARPGVRVPQQTQHLNWLHEAIVVEVDAPKGRVITFETGPIGLEMRLLSSVVNRWNVYSGFATSAAERPDVDRFLKDILPNR